MPLVHVVESNSQYGTVEDVEIQPSLSAELLNEYAPTKKPEVGTLPLSLRQILLTDAVPPDDTAAVPRKVNLPAFTDPSAGDKNVAVGFSLATVKDLLTEFDFRPLESTK